MYVKQIDQKKALELVEKGLEVKVLVPGDVKNSWEFEGGFALEKTFDYQNPSGYTESYDVYKSTNAGLGSTTVTVK